MDARGPQNGGRGLERCPPLGSKQLSLTKIFDPSTSYMRKGRDGGNGKNGGKKKEKRGGENPDENSGRPLEHRTLAPISTLAFPLGK